MTVHRLRQFQELVQSQGGEFIAFRLGTFEDYAYEYLDYEGALRQVFGSVLPEDINPAPLRNHLINHAKDSGLTIHDLAPATIESARIFATMGKLLYYITDTHPTPVGHLLTAALIRQVLDQNHPNIYAHLNNR